MTVVRKLTLGKRSLFDNFGSFEIKFIHKALSDYRCELTDIHYPENENEMSKRSISFKFLVSHCFSPRCKCFE